MQSKKYAHFLLVIPFLVVGNRTQAMETDLVTGGFGVFSTALLTSIREHALETLAKGGVGAVFGAVGGYLLGSQRKNPDELEIVKLQGEIGRLKESVNKYRSDFVLLRRWKLNMLKSLKLPMKTEKIPKKIIFAIELYEALRKEIYSSFERRSVLEDFSAKQVLELYKEEFGNKEILIKLFGIMGGKIKKRTSSTSELQLIKLPEDYKKQLQNFTQESMKMRKILNGFFEKKIETEYQLKRTLYGMRKRVTFEESPLKEEPDKLKVELEKVNKEKKEIESGIKKLRKSLENVKKDKKKPLDKQKKFIKKKKTKKWKSLLKKKK